MSLHHHLQLRLQRPAARSWLALLLACSLQAGARAADLTVSAPSSLLNAFREIGVLFEASRPGDKVRFNFAASGALLQQLIAGAPVDVYASADRETMDLAQQRGLIDAAQRRDIATNTLVLVVPAGSANMPRRLEDLTQPEYRRVAVGLAASVPAGRQARAVLERAGLMAVLQDRLIATQNVRQALDYVARGEVDAAFVYATDAAVLPGKVTVALRLSTPTKIVYAIAPLRLRRSAAAAPEVDNALQFVDFVLSTPAQAVLARHGFGKPE